jgi:hypothetical protein
MVFADGSGMGHCRLLPPLPADRTGLAARWRMTGNADRRRSVGPMPGGLAPWRSLTSPLRSVIESIRMTGSTHLYERMSGVSMGALRPHDGCVSAGFPGRFPAGPNALVTACSTSSIRAEDRAATLLETYKVVIGGDGELDRAGGARCWVTHRNLESFTPSVVTPAPRRPGGSAGDPFFAPNISQ